MTKFKSFFVLLLLALSVVSCDPSDDNNNNSNDAFADNFGNATSKDFLGQIVDEDNNPIQNVAIKIGSSTAQTDVNGVFIINGANVYEKFAYITAQKAGFIDGSRAIVPSSGTNRIKIMMLSESVISTVNTGVASEVVLPNGTKVVFDGNFKTETGSAYSGAVSVIMHHLDPADPNIADKIPGMLFAESADGVAKVLETYGMMNVELRGSGGEKLQISNTAQIEMPITATQLVTAPATIPLWHFDETLGYWKEEGSATKQGNKYVGTVSHFSWWNCDMQFSTILLTLNFVDTNGNPLAGIYIKLLNSNNEHAVGETDNYGQISGFLPANQVLTLNVNNFSCEDVIYSSSIGPFSTNTIVPNIVIGTQLQTSSIIDNLLKCDNSAVSNGYIYMQYGNQSFIHYVSNGSFNIPFLNCSSNSGFRLIGFDSENSQISSEINGILANPITDVGTVTACNSIVNISSLAGLYTVIVTRNDGNIRTFTTEMISSIGSNQYKTTTTGLYGVGELNSANDIGFNFIKINGYLQVPEQNLGQVYSNIVKGLDSNNGMDGSIINSNSFQVTYGISFAAGIKTYTAVYTRN